MAKRTRKVEDTSENAEAETYDDRSIVVKKYADRVRNYGTAIRAFCVSCMGGYVAEISRCSCVSCPLYPFRMGKNPYHKKAIEAREAREAKESENE